MWNTVSSLRGNCASSSAVSTSATVIPSYNSHNRRRLLLRPSLQRRQPKILPIIPLPWFTILLLLVVTSWSVNAQSTVDVNLIPFQILYTSSNADEATDKAANAMQILAITRQHLIDYEFSNQRGFVTLTLYQTVRTTTNSNRTTLIAYTGTATYNDDGDQHLIDQDMMFMRFFGSYGTTYITCLQQQAGWTTLQEIELMTMTGNYVYMNENGTTININNDNNNSSLGGGETDGTEQTSTTSKMNNNMQTYIYLIAVCIPVGIVFLCGLCYIVYMLKYNVQWTWHENTGNYDEKNRKNHLHPIWVVHTNSGNAAMKKRKSSNETNHSSKFHNSRTLDFTDINDPTNTTNIEDDYCSDELTFDDEGMDGDAMAPSDTLIPVTVTMSSSTHDEEDDEPLATKQKKKSKRVTTSMVRIVGVEDNVEVEASGHPGRKMKKTKPRNASDHDAMIDHSSTAKQSQSSTMLASTQTQRSKRSSSRPSKHLVEV